MWLCEYWKEDHKRTIQAELGWIWQGLVLEENNNIWQANNDDGRMCISTLQKVFQLYTPTKVKHHPIFLSIFFFLHQMGDYAWSEHIVMVFLACQITIKNVQVQLTVKGKTTPESYTPTPKSSCAQNVVVLKWSVSLAQNLARPSVGRNKKRLSTDQWTRLHVRIVHPKWSCDQSNRAWRWPNVNWTFYGSLHSHSLMVGGVWLQCVC